MGFSIINLWGSPFMETVILGHFSLVWSVRFWDHCKGTRVLNIPISQRMGTFIRSRCGKPMHPKNRERTVSLKSQQPGYCTPFHSMVHRMWGVYMSNDAHFQALIYLLRGMQHPCLSWVSLIQRSSRKMHFCLPGWIHFVTDSCLR